MSAFNVAKFGGTSVANFDAMSRCAEIIENNPKTRLVVSSACSGVTNILVELANGVKDNTRRAELIEQLKQIHYSIMTQLSDSSSITARVDALIDKVATLSEAACIDATAKLTDHLVACGERMSTHILTRLMQERGINAVRFDIRQVLKTDSDFGKAEPNLEATKVAAQCKLVPLCNDHIVVTQGFIGSDSEGDTTTLGRGGSDYSAALIAEAVQACGLEIWTDVPGIYTTDPRIAPNARPIPEISFSEASEMANFGAKILHPSTLLPALRHQIPVFVGSSKEPKEGGTWVKQSVQSAPIFRALALRNNQTMVTLRSPKMFQAYGFLADVFTVLAKHKISVDLVTTSEVSVSLTLDQTDTKGGAPQLPQQTLEELQQLCTVEVKQGLSVIALIGNNMSETKGSAAEIFDTLDAFNIRMICYGASPHNLCFLLDEKEAKQAVKALHQDLFE